MKKRRRQIACGYAILDRVPTLTITGTVNLTATDASACQRETEYMTPMVASAVAVDLGSSAEFAYDHYQGFNEQSSLI